MKKIVCQCGKKIRIYEKVRGKNGRCPRCNRTINVSANIWNTPPEIAELQSYSIIREISRGNIGAIYEAIDKEEKRYAIKIAHSSRENNILQNEYDILKTIVHKNIIQHQKLDIYNNRVYLVMDFIDGKSLEEVLLSIPKQLPFVLSLQIVYKLAKAIGYLHDHNIAHLNIKPANIMFSSNYDLKVINFSVAKYIGDVSLVSNNEYSHYLAPEQRVRQRAQSNWDIYSLGCILFELLTGESLVSDEDLLNSQPVINIPNKIDATIPKEISTICYKAIHLDPQKRYPSMTQLAYDIESYLGNIKESLSTQLQKYFKQLHSSGTFESINPEISIEKEFGQYKILQFSHRDNYGVIYKAIDSKTNKIVTLKALLNTRENETAKKSFSTSMNAIKEIDHSHIAKVFHFDTKPQKYYVMEYLWGKPIATLIGNSNYKKITQIFYEISLALDKAHSRIIHGNLQLTNILVNENLHPKIFDFGLTYMYEKNFLREKDNVYYISPQQLQQTVADAQTDVYSLGAILYHILTKRPPFEGSKKSILQQIEERNPIAPRLLNPDIPEALEAICMKSLHKSTKKRYPSAWAFSQDLKKAIERNYIVTKTPSLRTIVNAIAICFLCFFCLGLYNIYLAQKEQKHVLTHKTHVMAKEKATFYFDNRQWKKAALAASQIPQTNFATSIIYKSYVNSRIKWQIDKPFSHIKFDAEKKYAAGTKDNNICIFNARTTQVVSEKTFLNKINDFTFVDKNTIQIFFADESAILWDYQQQQITKKGFSPTQKKYKTNASYILSQSKNQVILSDIKNNSEITSWDISATDIQLNNYSFIAISAMDNTTVWDIDTPMFSHPGRAHKMKFFLKWFALYDGKYIWIYDTATKSIYQKIPTLYLQDFAFINNTEIAFLHENTISIFDLKIKKIHTKIKVPQTNSIIAYPPQNTLILLGKNTVAIEVQTKAVTKVVPSQQPEKQISLPSYIQKIHPEYQKKTTSFDKKLTAILDNGIIYVWNNQKRSIVTSIYNSITPQQKIQNCQFIQNDILEVTARKQKQQIKILDPDLAQRSQEQKRIDSNPNQALKYIFPSKKDNKK